MYTNVALNLHAREVTTFFYCVHFPAHWKGPKGTPHFFCPTSFLGFYSEIPLNCILSMGKFTWFSALAGFLFSSESSWTPKTQPNDSRAAVWLSFWCSTRPSAERGTYTTYHSIIIIDPNKLKKRSDHNDEVIGCIKCRCLPKAELNTKNSTKRQLCCRLVEFLVFNSIH